MTWACMLVAVACLQLDQPMHAITAALFSTTFALLRLGPPSWLRSQWRQSIDRAEQKRRAESIETFPWE